MKQPLFLVLMSVITGTLAFGGDVSVFKNLGFSADSRYFMFGQYGIDGQTKNPYAEVFGVDVKKNSFVQNGTSKGQYPVSISIGDDGQKALYVQLEKMEPLRKSLKLDFLSQGRPIYFRVVSEQDQGKADSLKVLDYESGREYTLDLKEIQETVNGKIKSSFVIDLLIRDKTGALVTSRTMGTSGFFRPGVTNYTISQIILTPDEKGLVIVVEKEENDGMGGINIRYMVETLQF